MTSQPVIFRAFLFYFFVPPTVALKKNPVNQLIKKYGLSIHDIIFLQGYHFISNRRKQRVLRNSGGITFTLKMKS